MLQKLDAKNQEKMHENKTRFKNNGKLSMRHFMVTYGLNEL